MTKLEKLRKGFCILINFRMIKSSGTRWAEHMYVNVSLYNRIMMMLRENMVRYCALRSLHELVAGSTSAEGNWIYQLESYFLKNACL
jgi:hypothetical protein